jgi:hypothetical protein
MDLLYPPVPPPIASLIEIGEEHAVAQALVADVEGG